MKVMIVKFLKNIKNQGFTLIEMAVVLIIIGLLMGSFLTPLSQQVDQLKIESTAKKLAEIEDALLGFAIINGHLPCPDSDGDGIENTPAACNIEGDLPWADLGLQESRRDEWGQPFRYRVDSAFAGANFPNPPNTTNGLSVQDTSGTILVANESVWNTSRIIAIIFSSGKNITAEGDNNNGDTVYTHDEYISGNFDDILIWIPKSILINRLAVAGKWPP